MPILTRKLKLPEFILAVLGIYTFGSLTNVQLEFHVKSAKSQLKSRLNYYYTTTAVLLNGGAVEGFHHDNLRKSQSSLLGSYQVYEFVEPLKVGISHLNLFFFSRFLFSALSRKVKMFREKNACLKNKHRAACF